ncbi:hypothetical protein KSP40_PGU017743 [Platanthera guangdongensis]|uniref:Uncharacterized protein n=1 Tax=Platanthera guangdongensis TaxID=2320717 RepID=A0ABR2MEA3_9ASPA
MFGSKEEESRSVSSPASRARDDITRRVFSGDPELQCVAFRRNPISVVSPVTVDNIPRFLRRESRSILAGAAVAGGGGVETGSASAKLQHLLLLLHPEVEFHIISHLKLAKSHSDPDNSSLHYLNMEQLTKCLLSLYEIYDLNRIPDPWIDPFNYVFMAMLFTGHDSIGEEEDQSQEGKQPKLGGRLKFRVVEERSSSCAGNCEWSDQQLLGHTHLLAGIWNEEREEGWLSGFFWVSFPEERISALMNGQDVSNGF